MGCCWARTSNSNNEKVVVGDDQENVVGDGGQEEGGDQGMQGVFAELKAGKPGLHHVEKNQGGPKQSTVPATKGISASITTHDGKETTNEKPPKLALVANRDWTIENYKNESEVLKIEDPSMNQNVCLRDCDGITAQIMAKINCASVDRCKNANLIVTDVISTIELIHCSRVKIQVTGVAQSMTIDDCDGVTVRPTSLSPLFHLHQLFHISDPTCLHVISGVFEQGEQGDGGHNFKS
eukprot:GHVN01104725.1.p1 GENE.GHVN01104725.1~~GHVN01104725.1.p1  ORF type:complete len:237 (+),score=36.70 GHVN01104725.1:33-743(+)